MNIKNIFRKSICMMLVFILVPATVVFASPLPGSKDLHKVHENSANGTPIYNNQIVSVQGIVTVPTGVWHDSANYFTISTAADDYRFAGGVAVYLPGSMLPQVTVGDKVVVTGTLSNSGYSVDKGTTVIRPKSHTDIVKLSSGNSLPPAFPIFTDAKYEQLELDKGYRFEGMPVRIMGILSNFDNDGAARGFTVDGSADGNFTDGIGAINVKLYSYSGIDMSGLVNGDFVVVEGVLFQSDATAPYTEGYYIRPTKQEDVRKLDANVELSLSEAMRKDASGAPVLAGKTVIVRGIATVNTGEWNSSSNMFTLTTPVPVPGMDPVYPKGAVLVYAENSLTPTISAGDDVTVTGVVGAEGYDYGMVSMKPSSIVVNTSGNDLMSEKLIRSDYGYTELAYLEGMPVKLQGRVYNINNDGVTRGFSLDASNDHNWMNQQGMIPIKYYNYSGIDLSTLQNGELLTVRGVLQKNDTQAPYDTGYFIRLRGQEDVLKRSEHTRRTVYIHLDAFRNDYIGRSGWDTANMEKLINEGSRCTQSFGEYVSMTTANMTTLVTGSHTSTHDVPALAFYDKSADRRVRNLQNYDVATIGEVYQQAGLITAAVKQRKLQDRGADFMLDGGTIAQTRDNAVNMIKQEDPDLLVVLFNETDSVAHKYGTDSVQIQQTVEEVDDAIGSIVNALREKGVLDETNIVIASDHNMGNVHTDLTQALDTALAATGIPYENALVDMGPFAADTKVVYNLSSAAAQIYFRQPLTQAEIATLTSALSGIEGVASVYNRTELDAMNTPANLGDLVVDCSSGYAFSPSAAEHGSKAQQQTFLFFNGPGIKPGIQYGTLCKNVDIVPTLYHLNGLPIPSTVDGRVLTEILQ